MKSFVIFPETAWTDSVLGFAGIQDLIHKLREKKTIFKVSREYQALVLEIDNLDKETEELVTSKLPENYDIPVLLRGDCAIFSKEGVTKCVSADERFQKLLRDAHLSVTSEKKVENIHELTLADINRLCNDFADSEGIQVAFRALDIEQLHKSIHIDKRFEHRLTGILVDIKSIWFALDYDLTQVARNQGKGPSARFKRYIYANNAIVRIRALWEKLIGLAVLLEHPNSFDRVLSKGSRARFIKDFKDSQNPVVLDIWDYIHSLEIFENRFRTPELHKVGRTIWWATKEKLGEETNRLLASRNDLNRLLRKIQERLLAGYAQENSFERN